MKRSYDPKSRLNFVPLPKTIDRKSSQCPEDEKAIERSQLLYLYQTGGLKCHHSTFLCQLSVGVVNQSVGIVNLSVSMGHVTDASSNLEMRGESERSKMCQSNSGKLRKKDDLLNLKRELLVGKPLGIPFLGVRGRKGCPLKLQ